MNGLIMQEDLFYWGKFVKKIKNDYEYDENGVVIDCRARVVFTDDGVISGESTFCNVMGLCVYHGRYAPPRSGIIVSDNKKYIEKPSEEVKLKI